MREAFNTALKDAMRSGDKVKVATVRMITAALKDRDIEARGAGKGPLGDDEILSLMQKMIKQRQESQKIYEDNGRPELAAQEAAEIALQRQAQHRHGAHRGASERSTSTHTNLSACRRCSPSKR